MDIKTPQPLKPIEIFRSGTFTAVNGRNYTFSPEQVRELADTYKPEFSDAPFVVGHPKLTSPRFGRAGKLFVNAAGVLCAEPADVVAEFAAAVNAKHYPKVSASIFLPDAPGNPTPGKHYLRHIGFLGGVAPAVKGLQMVEFADSEEGIVEFGYEDRIVTRLFRNLREYFIELGGAEKADQIIPSYELDSLQSIVAIQDAHDADTGAPGFPAFSDPTTNTEAALNAKAALDEQAIAQKQIELTAREAALAVKEAALNKAAHADFAEALCAEGRLLPAAKTAVIEIIAQLESVNQVADFAAGDANHGKTGTDLFKQYLSAQPKVVEFERFSKPAGQDNQTADFAAPMGAEVDADGLQLLGRAQAYQREHPGTDFMTAIQAVQAS